MYLILFEFLPGGGTVEDVAIVVAVVVVVAAIKLEELVCIQVTYKP